MSRYLTRYAALAVVVVPHAASAQWFDQAWGARKLITIDHTRVSTVNSTTLTDFPLLIQRTDTDWRTTANGGSVGRADGGDFVFTAADGVTQLDHEIASYDATTGALVAWVRVPSLAGTADTRIHVYYGNAGATPQGSAGGAWDANHVVVLHLDEQPANGVAGHADASGTGNAGTPNGFGGSGSNVGATGRVGGGNQFDGVDDYVSVASSASLQIATALTLSGWIYADTWGTGFEIDPIVRKGEGNPNNYQLAVADGRAALYLDDSDGNGFRGDTVLATGAWIHVAATWDGSNVRVFVNGVQDHATPFSRTGTIAVDTRALYTGGRAGSDLFDGLLDEVRVSNVARSADWIVTAFNNQDDAGAFFTVGSQQTTTPALTVGPAGAGACGGSDCGFTTLQEALDTATAGDTITVYRRTGDAANNECYDEHITIGTADLTLRGAGTTAGAVACIAPSTGGDIVTITADGVTLQDLFVSGKANDGAGGTNSKGNGGRAAGHGVLVTGNDLHVDLINVTSDFAYGDNIRFDGDQDADGNGALRIKQCYLHHADTGRNLRIIGGGGSTADRHIVRNNLMHTAQGVLLSGTIEYATIDRNVIKGWPYYDHLDGAGFSAFPKLRSPGFGGGWLFYSNCIAGVWVTSAGPADLIVSNNLVIGARHGIRVNTAGTIENNTIVNPFNCNAYDYNGTIDATAVRDNTYGIMIADGFSGTIRNNIVSVTAENRATGEPGQNSGVYYTPGITAYGLAFADNSGTLNGATITSNNVFGFVDTDGTTQLNYGSGIEPDGTNLSVDPLFAGDEQDETTVAGGSCPADTDGTRCYEMYEDNYFPSSTGGSCHAQVVSNVAGAAEFVDLSGGGVKDPDTDAVSALGECINTPDAVTSPLIDFGSGAVRDEDGKSGGAPNVGAFGGTARASESGGLHITRITAGDGSVRDGVVDAVGPGIIQPASSGLTQAVIYFNRAVTMGASGIVVRDYCDTQDIAINKFDPDKAAKPPYKVKLKFDSGLIVDEAVRIIVLGDGADRVVDSNSLEALDGDFNDAVNGTLPSGDGTAGGNAEFVLFSLVGDVDGDGVVEGQKGGDDYQAIVDFVDYPAGSCGEGVSAALKASFDLTELPGVRSCPEDLDGDGDIDSADLAIVTAADGNTVVLPVCTILSEDFNRADGDTVGNQWVETDAAANAEARIVNQRLDFTASDNAYEPLVSRTFASQGSGRVQWRFTFNMERTGSEGTYRVAMQLGDSATLTDPATNEATGVAVNLVWGSPNQGLTNTEGLGYIVDGAVSEVGVVSGDAGFNAGGDATVTVTVDLDANTYDLAITGAGLISGAGTATGIPFENNVDIDTVRFYLENVSDANFGDLQIDDVSLTPL